MASEPADPAPEASPDLSGVDIDLAQCLLPAWAREDNPASRGTFAFDISEEASDSAGRNVRDRRRPRRDPRRDARRGSSHAKTRPHQKTDRERRPRDASVEDRTQPPTPVLKGWSLEIQSEARGVEAMARQLKDANRAYPLFGLAGLILEKPERFRVSFKKVEEPADALYQVRLDQTLWLSEREAIQHVLTQHRDRYYRTEARTIEPPKGNFSFIAVCGMSGTVLGPPNFHDYNAKLMRLHAERFSHLPFEVFKGRVKMVRDEALLEQWKKDQSVKEIYFPVERPARPEKSESGVSPSGTPLSSEAQPGVETTVPADAASAEVAASVPAEPAESSAPTAEMASAPVSEESSSSAPADSLQSADVPAEAGSQSPAGEPLESRAALEAHFREHHLARVVIRVREKTTVAGMVVLQQSSAPIAARVRRQWEQLRRFPLPLAQRLGQQLMSRGLHLFKGQKRVTYVTPVRPRYLDVETTPVEEGIRGILEYLRAHPQQSRPDQWLGLVALRAHLPEQEREASLARDLLWLIREGHVIDFAGGRLEAARPPRPVQPSTAGAGKAESAAGEGEVPAGTSGTEPDETAPAVTEEESAEIADATADDAVDEVDAAGEPIVPDEGDGDSGQDEVK